jgi:tRNA threonylcarbamoyladenosine biosynthesis protein TsaE
MSEQVFQTLLDSPDATAQRAMQLAAYLNPGDTVLLSGDLGSGKTHFARSLIHSVLSLPEDVPSPTFTLVQIYETDVGPIWHADLYRIGSTQEIEELGLAEAFDTAICLVEWPDRLAELTPSDALCIELGQGAEEQERSFEASWTDTKWDAPMREAFA